MSLTPHDRAAALKTWATDLGFDLVGIARAQPSARPAEYRQWLADNKHGDMDYLAHHVDQRLDITRKLPWAKSLICLGMSYWHPTNHEPPTTNHETGKIARYAWGRDYHKVMEAKLKDLERRIRQHWDNVGDQLEIRAYCDTAPILEREFAARAGLGWIGKHTLLIHPRHGSWFVLGELVLSLDLEPDAPLRDHCGTCRRCMEACPTDAITPYSLDATKCISYLTLEHARSGPAEIASEFTEPMQKAGFVIGCDICQDVCPFNRNPLPTREPDFAPQNPASSLPLHEILSWQEADWEKITRGRAFRRAKLPMWHRTARILSALKK